MKYSGKFSNEIRCPSCVAATRLADQIHEQIRYRQYIKRTEMVYLLLFDCLAVFIWLTAEGRKRLYAIRWTALSALDGHFAWTGTAPARGEFGLLAPRRRRSPLARGWQFKTDARRDQLTHSFHNKHLALSMRETAATLIPP